jgi:hypothetical protein
VRGRLLPTVAAAVSLGVVGVALANGSQTASRSGHIHDRATTLAASSSDDDRDVMDLTDEPGNWFRSQESRSPLSVVPVGGRVDFMAGHLTNTKHTATLVN